MRGSILILSVLSFCWSSVANAQDSTKIKIGDKTLIIVEPSDSAVTRSMELGDFVDSVMSQDFENEIKVEEKKGDRDIAHWGGFEMGVSGLLNKDGGLELEDNLYDLDYSSSLCYNLNLFETKISFFGGYAGIVTGLGFNWNNYSFKGNTTLSANNDSTWATDMPGRTYGKNKLRTTYVKIPLLLEFNTSLESKKTIHIAGGVEGGFKLRSKTIQEYEFEGEEYEVDVKGHYNVKPWKLNAVGRIGYKNFTLFANYGLTTLFEKDKGPEMYPFEVGITIVGF